MSHGEGDISYPHYTGWHTPLTPLWWGSPLPYPPHYDILTGGFGGTILTMKFSGNFFGKRGSLYLLNMKYIITEQQYNTLTYRRRYNEIKHLIDSLSDNPSLYEDEDEFYDDVKDLVYKNVFLGNRKSLSMKDIDRGELMLFIDDYFDDYIRYKFREYNGY